MSASPRFSCVARLVLMLRRSALLMCLVPLMSACVLPIAPEFQDPPTSSNYPPYFTTTPVPDLGSNAMIPSFDVLVTDPNLGDDLYAKWIVDYPPYGDNTRSFIQPKVSHRDDGLPLLHDYPFAPNCVDYTLAKIARHQIMVVVADRPFLVQQPIEGQSIDLTRIPGDGRKVIGTWTLDMECK
jgi:hypothetical protein